MSVGNPGGGGGVNWPGPFQPNRGMQGMPQMGSGGGNMMFQMLLQQVMTTQMGSAGMSPMGLSHQNLYDRFQSQYFTAQHDELLKGMAVKDQGSFEKIFTGIQRLQGVDDPAHAKKLAQWATSASPFLIEAMPDAYDKMTGGESAALLGSYFMRGGRNRLDPISGRWGMSGPASQQLAGDVHKQMWGSRALREAHGMSTGEAGKLFWGLQRTGRMSATGGLDGLQADNKDLIQEAMDEEGFGGSFSSLNTAQRRKLMQRGGDPEVELTKGNVQKGMHAFNAKQVSNKLKEWSGAVEAMREIFGPQASIPTLLQGLEQLTAGASNQLSPERVQSIVRNTTNLAQASGVGLQGAMAMQQAAGGMAQKLGLDPMFTNTATRGMMAFTAGYGATGLGSHQAWGAPSLSQVQQAEVQLQLGAAGSQAANQMGALLRVRRMGMVTKGSNAERYLKAMDAGQVTYKDAAGDTRSMDLSVSQYASMVEDSTGGRMNAGQAMYMTQQTYANQELLQDTPAALATVRRLQGVDAGKRAAITMAGAARVGLARIAKDAGLSNRGVAVLGRAMGQGAQDAFYNANILTASNPELRAKAMAAGARQRLEEIAKDKDNPAMAAEASAMLKQADADPLLMISTAESMYAQFDQSQRARGSTAQLSYRMHHTATLDSAASAAAKSAIRTKLQETLSKRGKGDMFGNAVMALMDVQEGDGEALKKVISAGLGGVSQDKISDDMMAAVGKLRKMGSKYEMLVSDWSSAEVGSKKKSDAKSLMDIYGGELRDATKEAEDMFRAKGIKTRDKDLSPEELKKLQKNAEAEAGEAEEAGDKVSLVFNVDSLVMNAHEDGGGDLTGDATQQGAEDTA